MGDDPSEAVIARPHSDRAGQDSRPPESPATLWIADGLTARETRELEVAGESFVDCDRAARIQLPGLVVRVETGRSERGQRRGKDKVASSEWRRPALRAAFHLLVDPDLVRLPVREFAQRTGVANGTVVNLFDDLETMGALVRLSRSERRFVAEPRVVDRWIVEYERKLLPHTLVGRFRPARPDELAGLDVLRHRAAWGGESAASRLGASLRPGVETLYCFDDPSSIVRSLRLVPSEDGVLEVRRAFWDESLPSERSDLVPTLLVVADLLATHDGRCETAARELRSRIGA